MASTQAPRRWPRSSAYSPRAIPASRRFRTATSLSWKRSGTRGLTSRSSSFYAEALSGKQFANAQSERGNKTIDIDGTTLTPDGEDFVLEGQKFYCTGALFADWIVVRAANADQFTETGAQVKSAVYLPRNTPGLSIVDDWDGMGQKTTASGTVTLESVSVPRFNVVPFTSLFTHPTTYGAQAQILHAAIDTGIASAALRESVKLAAKARPFFEAKVDTAVEDPLLVQLAGEAAIEVRAARSLLAEAARSIDVARRDPTEDSTARASIDAATAKVVGARASLAATSTLFEIGGTRSAGESANLSRFWRDARTHTLHDPTRWKVQHIGRWTLSGTIPTAARAAVNTSVGVHISADQDFQSFQVALSRRPSRPVLEHLTEHRQFLGPDFSDLDRER